jgi:hypothetical protein
MLHNDVAPMARLCRHMCAVEYVASTAVLRIIQVAPNFQEWLTAVNDHSNLLPVLRTVFEYASGSRKPVWTLPEVPCESCMWDTSRSANIEANSGEDAVVDAMGVSGYSCSAVAFILSKLCEDPLKRQPWVQDAIPFLVSISDCSRKFPAFPEHLGGFGPSRPEHHLHELSWVSAQQMAINTLAALSAHEVFRPTIAACDVLPVVLAALTATEDIGFHSAAVCLVARLVNDPPEHITARKSSRWGNDVTINEKSHRKQASSGNLDGLVGVQMVPLKRSPMLGPTDDRGTAAEPMPLSDFLLGKPSPTPSVESNGKSVGYSPLMGARLGEAPSPTDDWDDLCDDIVTGGIGSAVLSATLSNDLETQVAVVSLIHALAVGPATKSFALSPPAISKLVAVGLAVSLEDLPSLENRVTRKREASTEGRDVPAFAGVSAEAGGNGPPPAGGHWLGPEGPPRPLIAPPRSLGLSKDTSDTGDDAPTPVGLPEDEGWLEVDHSQAPAALARAASNQDTRSSALSVFRKVGHEITDTLRQRVFNLGSTDVSYMSPTVTSEPPVVVRPAVFCRPFLWI